MSRPFRRLALSAIVLGLTLTLAAPPAQARESPPAGWFGALAHELAQWATGWWGRPPAARPPGVRPDCGIQIDPNGCPRYEPQPGTLRARRPPVTIECASGQIDPNGHCISN